MTDSEGIEWSEPVLVERSDAGRLLVALPAQVVERLGVDAGDVVSFSAFINGGIEVWSVKKSPYSSLDDEAVKARLRKEEAP